MKGVDSAHIRHLPPSPPPPPLTAMEKRLAAVTTPWPHVATLGVRFQRPIQQLYELYVLGCCFGIGTACIVPRSLPSHRSLPRTRFRCNSSINPKKKKKPSLTHRLSRIPRIQIPITASLLSLSSPYSANPESAFWTASTTGSVALRGYASHCETFRLSDQHRLCHFSYPFSTSFSTGCNQGFTSDKAGFVTRSSSSVSTE